MTNTNYVRTLDLVKFQSGKTSRRDKSMHGLNCLIMDMHLFG